jgi:hypothetical protein
MTATTIQTQPRTSHAVAAVVAVLTIVASVASVTLTLSLIKTATEMERDAVTAQATLSTDR